MDTACQIVPTFRVKNTYAFNFVKQPSKGGKHIHSKFSTSGGETHSIPTPIAIAFEKIMLERIQAGEEQDISFARCLMLDLIAFWNDNIESLRASVKEAVGPNVLKDLEMNHHYIADDGSIKSGAQVALMDTLNELKIVKLENNPRSLELLVICLKSIYI